MKAAPGGDARIELTKRSRRGVSGVGEGCLSVGLAGGIEREEIFASQVNLAPYFEDIGHLGAAEAERQRKIAAAEAAAKAERQRKADEAERQRKAAAEEGEPSNAQCTQRQACVL